MRYTGEICPVCKTAFTEDDDVVVCPDCGTPHHRKCYLKNKDCANAHLHTSGFTWSPAANIPAAEPTEPPKREDGHNIVFCPQCGTENAAEEPVCIRCGARLYNNMPGTAPFAPQVQLPDMTQRPYIMGTTVISPTETIGGNTVGDTAEYVGGAAPRYIPKFYKLEQTGGKVSWNWAAFLFAPYWFFYRKLYALGAVLTAVLLLVSAATTTPHFLEISETQGNAIVEIQQKYLDGELSQQDAAEAYINALSVVYTQPEALISFGGTFAIRLLSGLFANYWYKRKAEKDIQRLRGLSASPEGYRLLLFRRGGVSIIMAAAAICIFVSANQMIYIAISSFLS